MTQHSKVRTCLWFENGGLDAARFYVGLIPDSALETDAHDGAEPMIVAFSLAGAPYQILNGGPHYRPTPAASIVVTTRDQPETDRLWDALTANGGKAGQCGWLTDRWGLSWQITPRILLDLVTDKDPAKAKKAFDAMLKMKKIDIQTIKDAAGA